MAAWAGNAMNGVFMNPMAAPYLFGVSDVEHPDRRDDAHESDGNDGASARAS